uniref:Uncharacterized protein n=1 Tax=Latimeria chalumnae TaxID=7897 RepID=H3B944_LATCH
MALRTKVNGFTAWANMRLFAFSSRVNNVLTQLFSGTNMKALLQSFTGKPMKKMQSMDRLTQQQVVARVEWFVEELKKVGVIAEDTSIDCNKIAMKKGGHVSELLWKLIAHDIWFTWERSSQLQLTDDKLVCSVPFKWTPDPPPPEKKQQPPPGSALSLLAALETLSTKPQNLGPREQAEKSRWTTNLALKTVGEVLYVPTSFTSEDLCQADPQAICAYMCFICMAGYKFKQCGAVVNCTKELNLQIQAITFHLETFSSETLAPDQSLQRKELRKKLQKLQKELQWFGTCYDVEFCYRWRKHAQKVQDKTKEFIRQKMKERFDTVTVPSRSLTINDLCLEMAINLHLTGGLGFYHTNQKEAVAPNRKIVFPGSTTHWHPLLLKAIRVGDYPAVESLIQFFNDACPDVINTSELSTGNGALHLACRNQHFAIVQLLLENGASPDLRNDIGCTPLFFAVVGQRRDVCQLLIEWGCDFHVKDARHRVALDGIRSPQLREYLLGYSAFWLSVVPAIIQGNTGILRGIVEEHVNGNKTMASLQSRCIRGSTLLHTAAYFGERDIIEVLLQQQVGVNLLDYKGATPLHRSGDVQTMQLLLYNGADRNLADADGNTVMHVVSYGEPGKEVALDCLRFLLSYKVSIRKRNKKGLLPIHCAAIQGRIDVIQLLLQSDSDGEMEKRTMEDRANGNTPSMLYLALMNSHLKCAKWLAEQSFSFKPEEPEELISVVLLSTEPQKEKLQTLEFLVNHGVNINAVNNSGDSVLHLAAFRPDLSEVLALLLTKGAKVNEENGEHCTPLFCAVLASNMHAANLLIKHGANIRQKNDYGLTAFDYIGNYEEWIGSGLFSGSVTELLKAHDLKQSRSLVQQISRKLKT